MSSYLAKDVAQLLGLMSRNAELIAKAYNSRVVDLSEDNQVALLKMTQQRVFVRHGETEYRLSRSARELLNNAFNRQRNYEVSQNFSMHVGVLYKVAEDFQSNTLAGRIEDAERDEDAFAEAVFDIADIIESSLLLLKTLTASSFGNVSTIEAKIKQNKHYIGYAKTLGDGLTMLEFDEMLLEILESQSIMAPLRESYAYLKQHLSGWRRQHSAVVSVMQAFFYRLREIQPAAQRIRTMSMYLKKHPEYVFPEVGAFISLPDWASRFDGLNISPVINLFSEAVQDALMPLAADLELKTPLPEPRREAGTLNANALDQDEEDFDLHPIDQLFNAFIDEVCNTTEVDASACISSIEWLAEHDPEQNVDGRVWLMKVSNVLENMAGKIGRLKTIDFQYQEAERPYPRSGNIALEDVLLVKVVR